MIIYINGRFLTQRTTGVQRFAREIVLAIDAQPEKWGHLDFHIVVPENYDQTFRLKNITLEVLPGRGSYFWEQVRLPRLIKKRKADYLLSLCNLSPLALKRKNVVCIHDLAVFYHPETYRRLFVTAYRFIFRKEVRNSALILTVTNFSKKQIQEKFRIDPNLIFVVNNAVSPSFGLSNDETIGNKVSAVLDKPFFFSVGSASPNKNMKYVYACAEANPDLTFVISGEKNVVFNSAREERELDNLVYLGYVNDRELRALYAHCSGFIFPSFYEGFGIPPIEAVSCGCRLLIVSDIPVLREVLEGLNVNYIDPHDYENTIKFGENLVKNEDPNVSYSWLEQARFLIERLSALGSGENGNR